MSSSRTVRLDWPGRFGSGDPQFLSTRPEWCVASRAQKVSFDPFCMQDAGTLIAAIHRDWGEAQGNYDEFRFFTGMRPSEEIALVLSDLDLVNGIVSVNKARVAGVDRCQTKTGEDRRITLCPRALAVLKRQLGLRARLEDAGVVQHDYVFFRESGEPFWNLLIQVRRATIFDGVVFTIGDGRVA